MFFYRAMLYIARTMDYTAARCLSVSPSVRHRISVDDYNRTEPLPTTSSDLQRLFQLCKASIIAACSMSPIKLQCTNRKRPVYRVQCSNQGHSTSHDLFV